MKNFLSIGVVITVLLSLACPVLADEILVRKITPHTGPAQVNGTVILQVTNPNKISSVENIFYEGREGKLPLIPRKISVSGSYLDGNTVTVAETVAAETDSYSFTLPVLGSILSTFSSSLNSDKIETASVTALLNHFEESSDSITSGIESQQINASMVAKNVVVSRKGNKGKVSGLLVGTGAKGRFALKVVF